MQLSRWSRLAATLLLGLACLAFNDAASAAASQDVVVISVKGDVTVTMRGAARPVHTGSILELPAGIRTGADGAIALRQGPTTVSIAANTQIEIPASAGLDEPIDRVLQPRGSAFYDVGKRLGKKLRVETPYLVAVIKGTQFNVAVQGDGTTISLFEGQLEVRAPDDSDVVNINAGEIAIRHATDKTIRVLRMDKTTPPATPGTSDKGGTGGSRAANDDGATPAPGATASDRPSGTRNDTRPGASSVPGLGELVPGTTAANAAGVDASIRVSPRGESGTDAGLSIQTAPAALSATAGVGLDNGAAVDAGIAAEAGPVAADAGVSAGLGNGGATVSLEAGAAVGNVAAGLGSNTSVDLGTGSVSTGTSATVDAGPVNAGATINAGTNLSTGTVDAGAATSVAAGPVNIVVNAGAAVDVAKPAATVDTTVAAGPVNAGAGASLNVGTGSVSVDLSAAGVNTGLDLNLGKGTSDTGTGSSTTSAPSPPPAPPAPPAPGVLDTVTGLLGKHR
jgi:hypothetical protein